MKTFFILLSTLFLVVSVQAKTILVSDIDDTLKLANVQDLDQALKYSFDESSRFLGMRELYSLLKLDNPDMSFFYVSRAPSWWMENTHTRFLQNGQYPAGKYIPRTKYSMEEHKLLTIRELIEQEDADKVIFFGDNGEKDAFVYEQLRSEYERYGVKFYQFIRLVYSSKGNEEVGVIPFPSQVGFVTPVEVALELRSANLLSATSMDYVATKLTKAVLSQNQDLDEGLVVFPKYVRCNEFVWKWGIANLAPEFALVKEKVEKRCQK